MEYRSLAILYFLFVALATIYIYNLYINWPAIRARIESDWSSPLLESFTSMPDQDAAAAAGKFVSLAAGEPVKKMGEPHVLLAKDACVIPAADSIVGAEDCYKHNFQAHVNSVGGSYAQMTNNYKRNNPDSCNSNPLIGHFYKDA
jgi:hypothetical protein